LNNQREKREMPKMVILGLSGLNSELIARWQKDLPNIARMQQEGIWGKMKSTVPPTIPTAWASALSGRNPGIFGFWDLTYRDDFSYRESKVIDCRTKDHRVSSLYNILSNLGQKVAVINVPVTWPPPRIPGGYSISCFLTPDLTKGFTSPASLANEVRSLTGEYILDVSEPGMDYRRMEKGKALKKIYEMDAQRFILLKYFIGKKQCDAVFTVMMGADRMAHLFYRYADEKHRGYDPDPRYQTLLHDYYTWVDKQIGEVRQSVGEETVIFIVSDHSVQRSEGSIHTNEWLIREGYMTLSEYPPCLTPFQELKVDWSKTKAWATGEAGQVYVNLKAREAEGIVDSADYESLLDELISRLKDIPDEKGNALKLRAFKRHEIYSGPFAQYAPDLFVSFDECRYKVSTMAGFGLGAIHSFESTQSQDDGVNGLDGYFCIVGPGIPSKGMYEGASLLDVAPTVLDVMDQKVPQDMEGVSLSGKKRTSEEEEALVQQRLKFLGY
jgi:predicted AlkP superfamily phosphohydrolase/phosphomutase